jgi:hypothetical protein
MPLEDQARQRSGAEEYSFDELAKGVASGTISRSRVLKFAGAALLAAVFGASVATEEAEARRGRNRCSNPTCTKCGAHPRRCVCVQTTEGNARCLDFRSFLGRCTTSADCPKGKVCSNGPCGSVGAFCGSPCPH